MADTLFDDLPDATPAAPETKPGLFDDLPDVKPAATSPAPTTATETGGLFDDLPEAPSPEKRIKQLQIERSVLEREQAIQEPGWGKWAIRAGLGVPQGIGQTMSNVGIAIEGLPGDLAQKAVETFVSPVATRTLGKYVTGARKRLGVGLKEAGRKQDEQYTELAEGVGGGPGAEFAQMLSSTATQSAPLIPVGIFAGLPAVVFAAGMQTQSQMFDQADRAWEQQGVDKETRQKAALALSVVGGVMTAALTRFIPGGPDKLLAKFGAGKISKEAVLNTLRSGTGQLLKELPKEFALEGLEEGLDQAWQGVVERYSYNPNKTAREILDEAAQAGIAGGVLAVGTGGGTAVLVKGLDILNRGNRPPPDGGAPTRPVSLTGQAPPVIRRADGTAISEAEDITRSIMEQGGQNAVSIGKPAPLPAVGAPIGGAQVGAQVSEAEAAAALAEAKRKEAAAEVVIPAGLATAPPLDLFGGPDKPVRPPTTTVLDPASGFRIEERDVDANEVKLSLDVPNFKVDADQVRGIVLSKELKGPYRRLGTGRAVVWRRLNGDLEIITGRHKWDLAKRENIKQFPVQIVSESDGFTKDMATTFDAEANILDGQGTIEDYAHYFRNSRHIYTEESARQRGLLRDAKGKAGWDIGFNATDDLYAIWRAGRVTDAQAVAIAKAAPRSQGAQQIGIRAALDGASAEMVEQRVRRAVGMAGPAQGGADQPDFPTMGDDTFETHAAEEAKADAIRRSLKATIQAIQGAAKNPEVAKKYNVNVKDPASVIRKIAELKSELVDWEGSWWLKPELLARVQEKKVETLKAPVEFPKHPPFPKKTDANIIKGYSDLVAAWKNKVRAWLSDKPENKAIVWEQENGNVRALTKNIGEQAWRVTNFVAHKGAYMPWGHEVYKTREEALFDIKNPVKFHDKMPGRVMDESEIKGYVHMADVGDKPIFWYEIGSKPFEQLKRMFTDGLVIDSLKDNKIAYTRELTPEDLTWSGLKPVETLASKAPVPEPKFKEGDKVIVGELGREGTIAAHGPYKGGEHWYFVNTNLGKETPVREVDLKPIPPPSAPPDVKKTGFGSENKVVTNERADELKARIARNMKKPPPLLGGIPDLAHYAQMFSDAVQLGAYYIEGGFHRFEDWVEKIKEHFQDFFNEKQLRSIYETTRITIESPRQEGAGGRSPGLQPGLRPPDERIITARPELTQKADESIIPQELVRHLDPHQRQDSALAINAVEKGGGFLNAGGTGAGKTRIAIAFAAYWAKKGFRVVITTPKATVNIDWKKNTFGGSYGFDSNAMGVNIKLARDGVVAPGQIGLTTYQNIDAIARHADANTILIFDEAHYLKNNTSQRAKHATRAAGKVKGVLFLTATPGDKPEHIYYLNPIGIMEGKSVQDQLRFLGMMLVKMTGRDKQGRQYDFYKWIADPKVTRLDREARFNALFDRMTKNGVMVKREISMDGVHVQILKIALPPEAHQVQADIVAKALEVWKLREFDDLQGLRKAIVLGHQRRQQEPFKIASTVLLAQRELAAGRQVVIFVSRVNASEVGFNEYVTMSSGEKEKIRHFLMESEGTAKTMREALEDAGMHDIADIHGNADQSSLDAMADFQAGRKRVVIATIESGGTGINLDDTVGNRPRTMIMVTAPFDAVGNIQAAGRIWRLKTLSGSSLYYLFGDTKVDEWNAGIIGEKMALTGAVVEGQVRRLDISNPDSVTTDDYHEKVQHEEPVAPTKAEAAPFPKLDWKPFQGKFIAMPSKAFWTWYNANGKNQNPLGVKVTKWQDDWRVMSDKPIAAESEGEAPKESLGAARGGISEAEASAVVEEWKRENPNAPGVALGNNPDLTRIGADGNIYGVIGRFIGGKLDINLAYVESAKELRSVLEHEHAHALLSGEEGQRIVRQAVKAGLGGRLEELRSKYAPRARENAADYELRLREEWFSKLAEENRPAWKRIVDAVRAWLAKRGIVRLTDDEVGRLILRGLKEGRGPEIIQMGNASVSARAGLIRIGGIEALTAYHGTPHEVDRFSTEKIGTGEGAQVYGFGLYFAGRNEVADFYRKNLAEPHLILDGRQFMKGQTREFQDQLLNEYGKDMSDDERKLFEFAAFQYFWDVTVNHETPEYAARQAVERIAYKSNESADWAAPIFSDIANGTERQRNEEKPRWVMEAVGGKRKFDQLTKEEQSAFWDLDGRIGWYKETITDAPERVRKQLEQTVAAQERNLKRAAERGEQDKESERWFSDAKAAVELLDSGKVRFKQHQPPGNLYTVSINADHDELLDWDKPLSEQSEKVKALLASEEPILKRADFLRPGFIPPSSQTGQALYQRMVDSISIRYGRSGAARDVSMLLSRLGIKGIRYLDQGSRGIWSKPRFVASENQWKISNGTQEFYYDTEKEAVDALAEYSRTYNYVVFSDKDITITHKNGERVGIDDVVHGEDTGRESLTEKPIDKPGDEEDPYKLSGEAQDLRDGEGVETVTLGQVRHVLGRPMGDAASRQESMNLTAEGMRLAGLEGEFSPVLNPDDPTLYRVFLIKKKEFEQHTEGRKFLEWAQKQFAEQGVGNKHPALLGNLINTIRKNFELPASGMHEFDAATRTELDRMAQSEASAQGVALQSLAGHKPQLETVALNSDVYLSRAYYEGFGGAEVDKVVRDVLAAIGDEWTDDKLAKEFPDSEAAVSAILKVIAANQLDRGSRVYRRVQRELKQKTPPTLKKLEGNTLVDEAVKAILAQAARQGIHPKPVPGEPLSPLHKLLLLVKPENAEKIDDLISEAVRQAERKAARRILVKEGATEEELATNYVPRTEDPELDGIDPSDEQIEAGFQYKEFAHWKVIRDNLLGYSPVTLKRVQELLKGDFKGVKFGEAKPKKVELPKIDLQALAKSPEAEVKRVLDAYVATIQSQIETVGASNETKQRIGEMIQRQVLEQLAARRKEIVENFFNPKVIPATTTSEKLRKLINAGVDKDSRFKGEKVNRLIRDIASKYVNAADMANLATMTRPEKQAWLDGKRAEVAKAERFAELDEATRDYLTAVTHTYLAERLQAAEESVVRTFLKGADAKFDQTPKTPEQRAASLEEARKKLEGAIHAGATDTALVEAVARKSAVAKLLPTIGDLAKEILATPLYRQADLAKLFAERLVKTFDIDPAQADKLGAVFAASYGAKLDAARKTALERVVKSLTPQQREVFGKRSDVEKIINLFNAGGLSTPDVLNILAREGGYNPPTEAQRLKLKSMAEKVLRLQELTKEEAEKAGTDPVKIANAKAKQLASVQGDVVRLLNEMGTLWAQFTKPLLGWNPLKLWGSPDYIRKNTFEALAQFGSNNLLFTLGFGVRQFGQILTQMPVYFRTRSFTHAWQLHKAQLEKGDPSSFWKTWGESITEEASVRNKSVLQTLNQMRSAMAGRTETKSVDRLLTGVHAMERLVEQSKAHFANRNYGAGVATMIAGWARYGAKLAVTSDVLHSLPAVNQEIVADAKKWMTAQGWDRARQLVNLDKIVNYTKAALLEAIEEAKRIRLATDGDLDVSPKILRDHAFKILRANAYAGMREMGMPADDFEAQHKLLADTIGYNRLETGGIGGIVAQGLTGLERVIGEKVGFPMAGLGYFGNAIGTTINRVLHFTPFTDFTRGDVTGRQQPSPWWESPADRLQRRAEMVSGTALGIAVLGPLIMSGLLRVSAWPPRDPEERDEWYKVQKRRPFTLDIMLGNGQFMPISINATALAFVAPYILGFGALREAYDKKEREQEKLNAEAKKKGLKPGKVKPLGVEDAIAVATGAAVGAIMGGRTASGLLGSFAEQGLPNVEKIIAGRITPLVPGLPMLQQLSRMAGVTLDPKLATVGDFLLPLPSSSAAMVNFLGDPVGTESDVQRVIQVLSGGTFPGVLTEKDASEAGPYKAIISSGFLPPTIQPGRGRAFANGEYRPMTGEELKAYTIARGKNFKAALEGLGPTEDSKVVQAAYNRANSAALTSVGVTEGVVGAGGTTASQTSPSGRIAGIAGASGGVGGGTSPRFGGGMRATAGERRFGGRFSIGRGRRGYRRLGIGRGGRRIGGLGRRRGFGVRRRRMRLI